MAEEQRCQAPEGHRLCANNCGFFGSPATLNLCSKCYRDFCLKEEQASSAKIAVEKSLSQQSPTTAVATSSQPSSSSSLLSSPATETVQIGAPVSLVDAAAPAAAGVAEVQAVPGTSAQPNRCSTCRKRVGLTGFRCRCGTTFCGAHRYPEQHGCSFDFKAVGREAIAKANPVVKADKLDKI